MVLYDRKTLVTKGIQILFYGVRYWYIQTLDYISVIFFNLVINSLCQRFEYKQKILFAVYIKISIVWLFDNLLVKGKHGK